ncbi:MAG TPA: hypothetical protein VFP70_03185 [Burkholderiales bacterium]|nr:hypothetical protein [Burkholderiales bacterium]
MLKTKLALAIALAFAGTVAIAHPWGMGAGRGGCMMGGGPGSEVCEAQMHERHEARVKAGDTDGDSAISKAEAEKALPGLAGNFEAVDTDKDGKVTVSELDAARAAGVHGGPGYGRGMGPGYGRGAGPGADPETRQTLRHERHEARVKAADTDGDGAISKAEAEKSLPRLATRFEAVDTDHDGKLTVAELDAAKPMGKRGGPGYGGRGQGYGSGPCWQQPGPPKE